MNGDAMFRRIGETRRYAFARPSCIEADCWLPDVLTDKATGKRFFGCRRRHERECPSIFRINFSDDAQAAREKEGWRRDP